jgi:L-threonylcarbamoyladenylate synthase
MRFTSSIDEAINCIVDGGVGVLPTDTIYGLVAAAKNESAVTRLYGLKQRESKPGTLIAASVEQLVDLGLPDPVLQAAAGLWPNPLSIIIPLDDQLGYLHQHVGGIAARVTSDKQLIDILHRTGPLLTTSANHPGMPSSTTIRMAHAYFNGRVDFYVDGGDISGQLSSTIISIQNGVIDIVREGAISRNELVRLARKTDTGLTIRAQAASL